MIRDHELDNKMMAYAIDVSHLSTCCRRQVGCLVMTANKCYSYGYNHQPKSIVSCKSKGQCIRDIEHIECGKNVEFCYGIHAEHMAIEKAIKNGLDLNGATLYCTHSPCSTCVKEIIDVGITDVIYLNKYPDDFAFKLLDEANVKYHEF